MGKDKTVVESGMAFTAGAFRPLRRSAGAKTAICMVAINPRNPGAFPEKEFTPVIPEKAITKEEETEEDLDASRREFLRVGVASVIGGWVVSGMLQDFFCNTMYNLSATMDGKLINMSSYRGRLIDASFSVIERNRRRSDSARFWVPQAKSSWSSTSRRTAASRHSMKSLRLCTTNILQKDLKSSLFRAINSDTRSRERARTS
mmetsp:Transcript_45063/g.174874  ORF Transcript_45063/g.174874 Transcript_45063/m.174874 type:complete len:203 (+) Transcript_45063:147-755(+)